MFNIGEYVKTYDGFCGAVVRKVNGKNGIEVHIMNDSNDIHICSEKDIAESLRNSASEIKIIQLLVGELDHLRKENCEIGKQNESYHDLLYGGVAH